MEERGTINATLPYEYEKHLQVQLHCSGAAVIYNTLLSEYLLNSSSFAHIGGVITKVSPKFVVESLQISHC